jgi:hypothetical protein
MNFVQKNPDISREYLSFVQTNPKSPPFKAPSPHLHYHAWCHLCHRAEHCSFSTSPNNHIPQKRRRKVTFQMLLLCCLVLVSRSEAEPPRPQGVEKREGRNPRVPRINLTEIALRGTGRTAFYLTAAAVAVAIVVGIVYYVWRRRRSAQAQQGLEEAREASTHSLPLAE